MAHLLFSNRVVFALLLCGLLAASTGCFYLPLQKSIADKGATDPEPLIGDEKSKRPIQPKLATRQQIIQLIGDPERQSPDGRVIGYSRKYKGGAWVFPLFFYATRMRIDVAYRFEFDSNAILDSYRMLQSEEDGLFGSGGSPSGEVTAFLDKIGPALPLAPSARNAMPPTPLHHSGGSSVPDPIWYDTP